MLLNYRYQLAGTGDARTAIAPRVTVILPSHGASSGVQVEVPVSHVLSERLISHSDAGFTKFRDRGSIDPNLAQSFIYALNGRMHLMLESVWTRTDHADGFVISPGVRWAYNFRSGLQIVPGIGVPIGVGPSAGDRSIMVYLSFEHPFR